MKIKITDRVKVKLTERAIEILKGYHEQTVARYPKDAKPFKPPVTDSEGYSEWEFRALMSTFGRDIWGTSLFEDGEIEVKGDENE